MGFRQKFICLEEQDQDVGRFGFFRGFCHGLVDGPLLCQLVIVSCLCPNLFLKGYQSDWIRAHPKDLIFNHLFKDIISKSNHILRNWALGLKHEFGGGEEGQRSACSSFVVDLESLLSHIFSLVKRQ